MVPCLHTSICRSDFCVVFMKAVVSQNGLLTTVAYKLGPDQPTVYALEVSIVNFVFWQLYRCIDWFSFVSRT